MTWAARGAPGQLLSPTFRSLPMALHLTLYPPHLPAAEGGLAGVTNAASSYSDRTLRGEPRARPPPQLSSSRRSLGAHTSEGLRDRRPLAEPRRAAGVCMAGRVVTENATSAEDLGGRRAPAVGRARQSWEADSL